MLGVCCVLDFGEVCMFVIGSLTVLFVVLFEYGSMCGTFPAQIYLFIFCFFLFVKHKLTLFSSLEMQLI